MLHHEEFREKPQYNMATPPFLDKPPPPILPNSPFSSKNFQTPPPISINFEKVDPPPFMKGVRTMLPPLIIGSPPVQLSTFVHDCIINDSNED